MRPLRKESFKSGGQQFHQYQQNGQLHLTLTHWIQKKSKKGYWCKWTWETIQHYT